MLEVTTHTVESRVSILEITIAGTQFKEEEARRLKRKGDATGRGASLP